MLNSYHRKKVDDKSIKSIELDGLLYLTDFCNRHGLRYYLAYGTLIGAVRHKGFIPWDHDIDILMPRESYDKLLELSDELNNDDWELLSHVNNSRFMFPFMKFCNKKTVVLPPRLNSGLVYGLNMDIFPLDACAGDEESVCRKVLNMKYRIKKLERKSYKTAVYKEGGINLIKRAGKKLMYLCSGQYRRMLLEAYIRSDEILRKSSRGKRDFAVYMYCTYEKIWEYKAFAGTGDEYSVLEFEGHSFTVPYDYDTVLRKTYGDYMKLPPVEQRKTKHSFTAYYI